jgi:sugar/nucleoside kinase (ribokinase family)
MISGIGCIAYDRVLFTNALWSDGKGKITKEEFRFGGNIRNALAAVASLGEEAAYLGTVSDAPEWKIVVDGLESSGISTDYIDTKLVRTLPLLMSSFLKIATATSPTMTLHSNCWLYQVQIS